MFFASGDWSPDVAGSTSSSSEYTATEVVTPGQLSLAEADSPTFMRLWLGGHNVVVATLHVTNGGGLEAVTAFVEELLLESLSGVDELIVAVLLIIVPLATEQSTVATRVIVSDAPEASEEKVTVRLLPDPPHTPLPVEAHETKVTEDGRLSVTTTELAVLGPLLFATIV